MSHSDKSRGNPRQTKSSSAVNPSPSPAKKPSLLSVDEKALGDWLSLHSEARYRVAQINRWLFSSYTIDPMGMSNLPEKLRKELAQDFQLLLKKVDTRLSDDGSAKLLFELSDRNLIESALIRLPGSVSFCLSSQVGCPVACSFCASGSSGFVRNLDEAEILEQFIHSCAENSGKRPDNIVFMGIGEPLLNYPSLIAALRILCSPDHFGISPRKITVSTSGISKGILRLAGEELPLNLAISLHASDDETRARLIPGKLREPVEEVVKAAEEYFKRSGRIVTIEYVLINGVNDEPSDARRLAAIAKRIRGKINLILLNPNGVSKFEPSTEERAKRFEKELLNSRAVFTRRQRRGFSAGAACGQLRMKKAPSKLSSRS